jgi:hypothetical protein
MRKFRALAWLLWLTALPGEAVVPGPQGIPPGYSSVPSVDACAEMLSGIKGYFAAHDPALLAVDITRGECPPPVLYEAAYYQGFAFYLLSDYANALADLELAHSLTGPWDEQILYYLWKIQGELKDVKAKRRVLEEFEESFPRSARLPEMRDSGRSLESYWEASAGSALAYLAGDRNYQGSKSRSFMNIGWNQEKGAHRFQEFLGASGNFSVDDRRQFFYGFEAGLQYRLWNFTARASIGPARSVYRIDTLAADTAGGNLQGTRMERHWDLQRTVALSQVFERGGDWDWTASLDYSQEGSSFAFFGAGWDMDRYRGKDWLSLAFSGEYRTFDPGSGCPDVAGAQSVCDASRLLAAEAVARKQLFLGRQILGWGAKAHAEKAVDSSGYWRRMGTAEAEYGLRLFPALKWTNGLEAGFDWDDRSFRPVFNATSSLTMRLR